MTTLVQNRFYGLDALRGIAALSVIFWHWQGFFNNGTHPADMAMVVQPFQRYLGFLYAKGWLAVDLFFQLSGFIFFMLYSDGIRTRKTKAVKFLVWRISRLYPLYFVTLLIVAILQYMYHAKTGDFFNHPFNNFRYFLVNIFMASSWGFESGFSFNAPAWSLSVEVLLYAIFFALCRLCKIRLLHCLVLIVIGVFYSHLVRDALGRGITSFFIGGVVLYFYQDFMRAKYTFVYRYLLPVLLVITLFGCYFGYKSQYANQFIVFFMFPVLIFSLAVYERFVNFKKLAILGDISYSSYLIHFPLQIIFSLAVIELGLDQNVFSKGVTMILFFIIVLVLSKKSHHYFEKPAQDALRKIYLNNQINILSREK